MYLVCSFEQEETSDVAQAFLASNPDFQKSRELQAFFTVPYVDAERERRGIETENLIRDDPERFVYREFAAPGVGDTVLSGLIAQDADAWRHVHIRTVDGYRAERLPAAH